mmetsp:Transcript_56152/g.89070  ORF Transcript_56152/g.89070 Transcript_56152/m.89070 type:complete len:494 (-) Transcript_56152:226-1707(-)
MKQRRAVTKQASSRSVKKRVIVKRSAKKVSPSTAKGQLSCGKIVVKASGIGGRTFEQEVDAKIHFATLKDALGKRWRIPPSCLKLIHDTTVTEDADRVNKYCSTANGCLDLTAILTTETLVQLLSGKAKDAKKLQGLADLRKLGRQVGEPGIEAVCACLSESSQEVRVYALSTLRVVAELNSESAIDNVLVVCRRDVDTLPICFKEEPEKFASWMLKVIRAITDKENIYVVDALVKGIDETPTETLLTIFGDLASCQHRRQYLVEQLVKKGLAEGSYGALDVTNDLLYCGGGPSARAWVAEHVIETIMPYLEHEDESTHKRALKALTTACMEYTDPHDERDWTRMPQRQRDVYDRAVAAISAYGGREGLTTEKLALRALRKIAVRCEVLSNHIKGKRAWLEGVQDVKVKVEALRLLGLSARKGDQIAVDMATAFLTNVNKQVRGAALDALLAVIDYATRDMRQHRVRRRRDDDYAYRYDDYDDYSFSDSSDEY